MAPTHPISLSSRLPSRAPARYTKRYKLAGRTEFDWKTRCSYPGCRFYGWAGQPLQAHYTLAHGRAPSEDMNMEDQGNDASDDSNPIYDPEPGVVFDTESKTETDIDAAGGSLEANSVLSYPGFDLNSGLNADFHHMDIPNVDSHNNAKLNPDIPNPLPNLNDNDDGDNDNDSGSEADPRDGHDSHIDEYGNYSYESTRLPPKTQENTNPPPTLPSDASSSRSHVIVADPNAGWVFKQSETLWEAQRGQERAPENPYYPFRDARDYEFGKILSLSSDSNEFLDSLLDSAMVSTGFFMASDYYWLLIYEYRFPISLQGALQALKTSKSFMLS